MAGILDSVNQRTQLVGQNRLELLLFKLVGRQRFGINVFKVREVMPFGCRTHCYLKLERYYATARRSR